MYQRVTGPFLSRDTTTNDLSKAIEQSFQQQDPTNNKNNVANIDDQQNHNETLDDIEALINLEESKYQQENEKEPHQNNKPHVVKGQQYPYNIKTITSNDDSQNMKQQIDNASTMMDQANNNNINNNNNNNNNMLNNDTDMQIITSDTNTATTKQSLTSSSRNPAAVRPYVEIIEQPARCSLRFRYECEGRSAGSLPGASSSVDNKTYPTIQVVNYVGRAVVVVSCVTKDYPYRPHPHNLVGKEGCKKGICTIVINNTPNMLCSFTSLGIQCVKKRDIEESLNLRETIQVDPFRTGFAHKQRISNIDLNVVRLCFQVFIEGPDGNNCTVPLTPVVSEPIYDKKAMSDLVITKLSHCSAPATGGREVILLCDRISKDDIQIRFYEESNGKLLWEKYSDFQPNDVHKQAAICFRTPKYHTENIQQPVMVRVQLKRPSDNQVSEPRLFQFLPCENDEDIVARKRQKIEKIDLNNYVRENILLPHQQQHHHQHHQMPFGGGQHQFQQPIAINQQSVPSHMSHQLQQQQQKQQQHYHPQLQQQHLKNQHSSIATTHHQHLDPNRPELQVASSSLNSGQAIYTRPTMVTYQQRHFQQATLNDNSNVEVRPISQSLSPNPVMILKTPCGSSSQQQQIDQQQAAYSNYHRHANIQNQADNSSRQNTPSPSSLVHQNRFQNNATAFADTNPSYYANDQQRQQQHLNVITDSLSPTPITGNNSLSPRQFSPTNISSCQQQQQHSPNLNVRMDIQRQNNNNNLIESLGDTSTTVNRQQLNHHYDVQQLPQKPTLNRVVVKHEIIDDDGKIMQIVERDTRQTSDDDDNRTQQTNRNQTNDANALSTRLDSLGLDGLDTTLMKEIAFNSALMLNLDSNLSLNLPSNLGIGSNNNTSSRTNGTEEAQVVATTSDGNNAQNQLDHTLNTPQVSELDPQPVGDSNMLLQLDDSSNVR